MCLESLKHRLPIRRVTLTEDTFYQKENAGGLEAARPMGLVLRNVAFHIYSFEKFTFFSPVLEKILEDLILEEEEISFFPEIAFGYLDRDTLYIYPNPTREFKTWAIK